MMVSINDLRGILENEAQVISNYTIGFASISENGDAPDAQLAGSGTLVVMGRAYAILTADHVIQNLPETGQVGLILPNRTTLQSKRLSMENLEKVSIGRGPEPDKGPDLGILVLPQKDVSDLQSRMSFYNLQLQQDRMRTPPGIDQGIWLLSGMAAEWTQDLPTEHGLARVKLFRGMVGAGPVILEEDRTPFDFLSLEAKYGKAYEGPEDYRGFSGSGLWQSLLAKKEGKFEVVERFLSGVAFYQTAKKVDQRLIICHGRQSIYRLVTEALTKCQSK